MTAEPDDDGHKPKRSSRRALCLAAVCVVALAFLVFVWARVHPSLESTKIATDFVGRIAWPAVVGLLLLLLRQPLVSLVKDIAKFKLSAGGWSLEGETTRTYDEGTASKLAAPLEQDLKESGQDQPPADPKTGPSSEGSTPQETPNQPGATVYPPLVRENPNMAMLNAFVPLERDARTFYRDFVPSEAASNRNVALGRIIQHLDPSTRNLFTFLARVRNGIVHGEAPDYSPEEATQFIRQCKVIRRVIADPNRWQSDS